MEPYHLRVAALLTCLMAGCSASRQPLYRGDVGCHAWSYAMCAYGRGPMVFRDGDPLFDMCVVMGMGTRRFWQTPILHRAPDGVTRVTATYGADGLPARVESDCGLEEPWVAELEWNADSRLASYRQPGWHDVAEYKVTPVYVDARLAAHDWEARFEDGTTTNGSRDMYTLDDMGRFVTVDVSEQERPLLRRFDYDGDRLVVVTGDEVDILGTEIHWTETHEYDEDGRLTSMTKERDPDNNAPGPEIHSIEWSSATTALVVADTGSIDVDIDDAGRLVRKEVYGPDGGHDATLTWEWDSDGRLVEFWMYGDE